MKKVGLWKPTRKYSARVSVRVREPHPALAQPFFQSILGNDKRNEKEIVDYYMTNSNRKLYILKRLLNTLCLAILDLGTIGFSLRSVDVDSTQGLLYATLKHFLYLSLAIFILSIVKLIFLSLISQDQIKAG